jgi:subtilase family serine protease
MESDVSAVADPATGVSVYDSYGVTAGWYTFGGTSVSAPIIAGVYALAGTPASGTYPAQYPYDYAGTSSLNDVTSGNNGTCSTSYFCTARPATTARPAGAPRRASRPSPTDGDLPPTLS